MCIKTTRSAACRPAVNLYRLIRPAGIQRKYSRYKALIIVAHGLSEYRKSGTVRILSNREYDPSALLVYILRTPIPSSCIFV